MATAAVVVATWAGTAEGAGVGSMAEDEGLMAAGGASMVAAAVSTTVREASMVVRGDWMGRVA